MVAYSFNAQQHQPQYGGAGGLPPGKYKGVIVDSRQENVEKNGQIVGGYLALDLTPIEGPLQGTKQTDRLNLHHTNPKTVEIANKQLSAYCHVLNTFQFNDTSELHNKPFLFEVGFQKGQEPSEANPNGGYTEVKNIRDLNGNEPGKAGNGPTANVGQQQPVNIPQDPAGGVQAQGGGWGGAQGGQQQPPANQGQQGQGGGWNQGGGQQQQPPANQGQGGWGGQQVDPNQGQQQQPPQNQGGAAGGWGGQQQPPQNQGGGAGGGWAQGAAGGAKPGWGAPG